MWIDFERTFEIFLILLAFQFRGSTPNGKGTNGGNPTLDKKVDDAVNAVDNAANTYKYEKDAAKEKRNKPYNQKKQDSVRETTYWSDGTERKSIMRPRRTDD